MTRHVTCRKEQIKAPEDGINNENKDKEGKYQCHMILDRKYTV